jgi:hypothetical protein
VLDHYFDDSSYSGKEAFVDATTGALGGGLVNPMIRLGSRANKVIRHSGRQVYKVGSGATESLLVAGYVTKPMISRPVRMEMLAGAAAGLVYDIAYKSSGSSSERNGTHVGPGGNTPGVYVPKLAHTIRGGKIVGHHCAEGYHPRVHRHKNGDISIVCVPNRFKGKKIRFDEK